MKPCSMMTEAELQEAVAEYLVCQYPDVMFHSDFGSGVRLTANQAKKQKRQNGGRRAWPDMFIARTQKQLLEVKGNGVLERAENKCLGGMFLELKKEGTRIKKKNGDWATEHIAEQAEVLEKLRQRGYCAEFAIGFEQAKNIIDEYLGGKHE